MTIYCTKAYSMTESKSLQIAELPLVSVVMPAYNAHLYIVEAIQSVLAQDYKNIELIVVDDGSSDDTVELACSLGNRVHVFERNNSGPAAARNFGISVAQGEFIAFLDADDMWLPGKLSAQIRYMLDHPDIGVVYGEFRSWYASENGVFIPPNASDQEFLKLSVDNENSGYIFNQLLLDNIVHIITAVTRKSILDSVSGFDESLRTGEDYDLWLRLSRFTRFAKFNSLLAYYRMHSQNTTKIPRAINSEYIVLRAALGKYGAVGPDGTAATKETLRNRFFHLCFSHGYLHYWNGNLEIARVAFREAVGHNRISLKARVYLFLATIKSFLYSWVR
jgi:glycosyltransferase involved in cell wall biosynthesis